MNASMPASGAGTSSRMTAGTIRRLCISLILAEQGDLIRKGQMVSGASNPLLDPRLSVDALDQLRIDEEGLGFDSLARLGLILRVNRFFRLSTTGVEDYLLMYRSLGDWVELIGQHLSMVGEDVVFTFDTSGSSGPIKHVTHQGRDLQEEVSAHLLGPFAGLAPGTRILALVPPHHIYGFLFTCLLPTQLGSAVIDLHRSAPTAVFRHARAGDLIVGTPLHWDLLQQSGLRLSGGIFGLTSAGPSTFLTWRAPVTLGLSSLTEVYGSTETGGVGTRTEGQAAFQLLGHLRQIDGQIGFRNRDTGVLELQDRLDWLSPTQFHVLGRKDDVVQVAGVNVSPSEIRTVLQAFSGVAEVAVRPGGNRLKAFIVPDPALPDPASFAESLHRHILQTLPAPARPTSLTFGPSLPRNAMGKLCDWEVLTPNG